MSTPEVHLWWPQAPQEHAVLRTDPAADPTGPYSEEFHTWRRPPFRVVPQVGESLLLTLPPDGEGPALKKGEGAGHFQVLSVQHVVTLKYGHYVVLLVQHYN